MWSREARGTSETVLAEIEKINDGSVSAYKDGYAAADRAGEALSAYKKREYFTIDGVDYIGVLAVPSLELTLPVAAELNYEYLRQSPCRYSGSAEENSLIIAAHNYKSQFGDIDRLDPGAEVLFSDPNGNVYRYEVTGLDTVEPDSTEGLLAGTWDMTLFTCTPGGSRRFALRCTKTE